MSGCAFSISSSSTHAVGVRADGVDEQAALLEADVAGRRADQARHRVLLHVLAHVEADELVAELQRQLLGELGLADAGRAGEQEAAGRPVGLTESGARPLDRLRHQVHRLVLAEHHALERFFERAQPLAIRRRGLPRRDARHARDDRARCRRRRSVAAAPRSRRSGARRAPGDRRFRARRREPGAHGAGLVEQIDGAVGQAVVAQVPRRQLGRRLERRVGVLHPVVRLVAAAQPGEDADRLLDRRLVDGDLLQPPRQRPVLLDVLVLLEAWSSR